MSVYNGSRWLQEAIRSVQNQTFRSHEFIIVNDGSTDASATIIKSFLDNDSRIRCLDKPHTGLADSLNQGIAQARGEWIARLDADDLCEPERLERQLACAVSDNRLAFVGSGLISINALGQPLKTYRYPSNHRHLQNNLIRKRRFPAHSSAFFRTSVVRSLGGYRARIKRAEDWDLWLRLSEVGRLTTVDEALIRHRNHPDQVSLDQCGKSQQIDSRVAITSYWLRRMGEPDPVDADDNEFEAFREWMVDKLTAERLFDYYEYLSGLKMNLASDKWYKQWSPETVRSAILGPRHIASYTRNLIFGESFTRRLAREWAQRSRSF